VHIVQTLLGPGVTENSVFDIGTNEGREVDSGALGGSGIIVKGTILVIAGVLYMRGNASYLSSQGIPQAAASMYDGHWISYSSTDADYASIADEVTLGTALVDGTPTGNLAKTGPRTVDHASVIGISGGLSGPSAAGSTGSETIYVAQHAPYLPVKLVRLQTVKQATYAITATLSRWHENLSIQAPANSTPIATVLAANG
jgi:hypothetical protein